MLAIPTFLAAAGEKLGMVVVVAIMLELGEINTGRGGVLMGDDINVVVPMPVGRVRRVRRVVVGGIRVRAWRVLVVRVSLLRVSAGPHPPAEEVCNPLPPVSSAT